MVHKLVELHGGTLVLTGGRGSGKSQLVKDLQRQGKDRSMKVFHVTKAQEFGDSNLINRHIAREDGRYHVAKDVSRDRFRFLPNISVLGMYAAQSTNLNLC